VIGPRRAARSRRLGRAAASGAILGASLLLSGCFATTKHVQLVESDLTRQGAWTDERFQNVSDEMEALRSENETLRLRVDDLADQIAGLGGEISARLADLTANDQRTVEEIRRAARQMAEEAAALDDQREKDRQELLDRMNVILEEVVKENARLAERIQQLEQGAFTFGRMHVVKPGESVASIASEYGVTPEEIVAANDLPDANLIQVGQNLLIPGVSP
jgi:chromosome segregation ATPase